MASGPSPKTTCEKPRLAHCPSDVDVNSFVKALQHGYHRDNVAKETLVGSKSTGYASDSVPIEKIYGRLRLIPASQLRHKGGDSARQGSADDAERMAPVFAERAQHARCVPMEDILKAEVRCSPVDADRKSARVLVLGGAGSGKTMSFSRKAAVDWANGRLWPEIEVLFALPLRQSSVSSAKNAKELLRFEHFGVISKRKRNNILDYLDDHWDRVCIILDGLDEVELENCSDFVKNIINGDALRDVHIIVTSRPSDEIMDLVVKYPFSTRLELVGFERQDVKRYVQSVLKPRDAAHFMRQVDGNAQLSAFMQTPLNCVNACALYRTGTSKLPTTVPAMVSALLRAALLQVQQKRDTERRVVADQWEDVAEDLKEQTLELAAFAFNMLVTKVTLFGKEHLEKSALSKDARGLGLLVAFDDLVFDRTPQWKFSHLTLQEALAARYISTHLCVEEVSWLVGELGPLTGSLNTFWRCLAAEVDEATADALIGAILAPRAPQRRRRQPLKAKQHCDRHQVSEVLNPSHQQLQHLAEKLSQHLDSDQADQLADRLLSKVIEGEVAVAVHSVMPRSRDLTTLSFLQHLLLVWKRKAPRASLLILHRAVADIHRIAATTCFPSLTLTDQPQSRPTAKLRNPEGRQRLLLAIRCYHEFSSAMATKPMLFSLKNAFEESGLDLDGIRLTTSDSAAIGLVLEVFNSVITHLDIYTCYIGDEGFLQLSDGLSTCNRLQTLNLSGNALSDKHAASVRRIIRKNRATLHTLNTCRNHFSSDGNTTLHQHTHQCKRLLVVSAGGTKMTCSVKLKHVLWSILASCNLQILVLTQFKMTDDMHAELFRRLATVNITDLSLTETGMSVQSTGALNTFLQQRQRHLIDLSLTANNLTDDFVSGVQHALARCSRLQKLSLAVNQLTSGCLSDLAILIGQLPCLIQLQLSNNDFRAEDDGAALFAYVASKHPTLQNLEMPAQHLLSFRLNIKLMGVPTVDYNNLMPWEEMMELKRKDGDDR